ncbi:MAG TPA: CrcB family protein [Dehalococcoidia bacterium]|jgi:CrcB protein|nr:CrcB family protein [Dehalococcoidia bacterium]
MTVLAVAVGGALGAVTRYLLAVKLYGSLGVGFPWGTFGVNIAGSLMLGVIIGLVEERNAFSPEVRTAITVGFIGGLTTFSTFVYESWTYLRDGNPLLMAVYVGISLVAGLAAFTAGHAGVVALES